MLRVLNKSKFDKEEIFARALEIRTQSWGNSVTYSRKIFVPLTNMCRDQCGYCTFVKDPGSPEANIMDPESVMDLIREGERTGCKEVLLSLGERPELRHLKARLGLQRLGFSSMLDYLRFICEMILRNSSLLPHINAGTLSKSEISDLKPVSASMGMMLENTSRRLVKKGMPHYKCPDKVPIQRLRTMDSMGELKVPFTTGILIGIGETWEERLDTISAIERSHRKYGQVQEVIIQNFVPKSDIPMRNLPAPDLEDMLNTIAVARTILSPEISIQAPPNLSEKYLEYLRVGLNDWGGISPVTADHINPEKAWPEIEKLAYECKSMGFELRERLTVYPRYHNSVGSFLGQSIAIKVRALSREDGLAEDQVCP